MRYFKSLILMAVALFAASCNEKEPVEVPKEPEAPVVVSATLRGADGETEILAGRPVKFRAEVTVKNSELSTFTLEIKKDGTIIGSASGELSGTESIIDTELDLALSLASLDEPFFPAVTLKVTNTDEMFVEKTLTEAENVKITTMELMDALWLVDNLGFAYQMSPTSQKGKYRTTADLEVLGTSFQIVSKVTAEGAADPSGENYGTFDTPESGEYGLYWVGYDVFTGELSKCLDYTCVIDMAKMATDGDAKVFWSYAIAKDCRVVFLNFPEGLQLQADRWADVDGNTARYTGHDNDKYEVYYLPQTNWLVLKEQWSNPVSLWVTGENAGLPMSPYCGDFTFNWFGGEANWNYSWDRATAVMKSENDWEVILYLKSNFALKLYYTAAAWGSECDWTSTTPETLVISPVEADPETGAVDGNYGNAGPSFTEGLWTLKYNTDTEEVSLEKYLGPVIGGVATGDKDPDAPEPDEPDVPDVPEPEVSSLYLVDNNGNAWAMSVLKDTHFITDETTENIGTSFRFAAKYADGKIDESGYVSEEFTLDEAYGLHGGKKPWKIGFDKNTGKVIYRVGIWRGGEGADGDGAAIIEWVTRLPQNSEVFFFGFDKPVSQIVNTAIFTDIDDAAGSARYIGISDSFETWYRPEQGWLLFNNNDVLSIGKQNNHVIIGRGASFPQSPYTDLPIAGDLSGAKTAKTIPLFRISESVYRTDVYLSKDFEIQFYSNYNWGSMLTDWTSDDVEKKTDGVTWMQAKDRAAFMEGIYTIEYDSSAKTVNLTLVKAMGQEPEPETPPASLILKDNNEKQWTMSLVSGSHYVTDGETGEIGTSFKVMDPSGKEYGEYQLDEAYSLHGGKKPWKVGYDLSKKEVVYRVGIWRGGEGADGDGAAIIEWVTRLPQNSEVFFFGFDKPVSQIVNTAIFTDIDDAAGSARYIGISDSFETWYRPEQGWLVFNNNDALSIGKQNNHVIIGRGASFPQSPYTDYPVTGDLFGAKTAKTIPLFRISESVYRTDVYLSKDFEIQMYANYRWADNITDWTSDDVEKKSENVTWMQAKDRAAFVEGIYTIEYDSSAKTVKLIKK